MTGDFEAKRDLGKVMWLPTLQLNGLRSVGAGVVWAILTFFLDTPSGTSTASGKAIESLTLLLSFPVMYFVILLPIGLFTAWLSRLGVPWIGLVSAFFSLMIFLGDPLVFIGGKLWKPLVPTAQFGFMNFNLVIFVTDESGSLSQ